MVAVNDQPLRLTGLRAAESLMQTLGSRPGRKFKLRVLRDGRTLELAGVCGRRPEPATLKAEDLGVTVQALTDVEVFQRSLFVEKGVLVTDVERGSPAATGSAFGRTLLIPGDVIVALDGRATPSIAEFRKVLEDVRRRGRDSVLIQVMRGRAVQFEAPNLRIGRAGRESR